MPLAVMLWVRSLLCVLVLGPLWFCGVVAMLDRGQPGLSGWIALMLRVATGLLFLPNLLPRVR
jgi:hypothetical protein